MDMGCPGSRTEWGMPRYFFHFSHGKRTFTDADGVELANVAAARKVARDQIRTMRADMREIQDWSGWQLIAVDMNGKRLFEVRFDLKPVT